MVWFSNKDDENKEQNQSNQHGLQSHFTTMRSSRSCQSDPDDHEYLICTTTQTRNNNGKLETVEQKERIPNSQFKNTFFSEKIQIQPFSQQADDLFDIYSSQMNQIKDNIIPLQSLLEQFFGGPNILQDPFIRTNSNIQNLSNQVPNQSKTHDAQKNEQKNQQHEKSYNFPRYKNYSNKDIYDV